MEPPSLVTNTQAIKWLHILGPWHWHPRSHPWVSRSCFGNPARDLGQTLWGKFEERGFKCWKKDSSKYKKHHVRPCSSAKILQWNVGSIQSQDLANNNRRLEWFQRNEATNHVSDVPLFLWHAHCSEHASESLKLFENALSDSQAQEGEAGTIQLIRTACKAFEKRGDEKSGYPLQLTTYLKKQGIDANPFIHFRGNHFNVVFANGGCVYYLREHIINFLTKTWGTPNRLLKPVLEDATNNLYIAGCKALGLIDKFITGPLWRILESDIHILDLSDYYTKLLSFLENCKDASEFMTGANIPFPDTPVKKDALWTALVTPSSHDPCTSGTNVTGNLQDHRTIAPKSNQWPLAYKESSRQKWISKVRNSYCM